MGRPIYGRRPLGGIDWNTRKKWSRPSRGDRGGGSALDIGTTFPDELTSAATRTERDSLGEVSVPAEAYWGVHTMRAIQNFPITGLPIGHFSELVRGLVYVKQAAARVNRRLGTLDPHKADAIDEACRRILASSELQAQFVVDAIQGGAGTSTNMNTNEVIANVALGILGRPRGDYSALHPNDDVNMAQSTNDAYPTAIRLAVIFATHPLAEALEGLARAFAEKAIEFGDVVKIGRTQLQDAVPMTLGQEFGAFSAMVREDIERLHEAKRHLWTVNIGATAIGTGLNADPRYAPLVVDELAQLTQQPLKLAENLIQATSDTGDFVLFSGILKGSPSSCPRFATIFGCFPADLVRVLLRLFCRPSKPARLLCPARSTLSFRKSSISRVCRHWIRPDRDDVCEGGQLQLNAFEPTIAYCILSALRTLTAAVTTLTERCISGIQADTERCCALAENSIGLVTALCPLLGYEVASRVAKRALNEKCRISDIILDERLLTEDVLRKFLRLEAMTAPRVPARIRPQHLDFLRA